MGQDLWWICIIVKRYRLWFKSGGLKSMTGTISSAIWPGSKWLCPGGSTFCSVAWLLIGALLPVMKSRKCSIACNSSWSVLLWHCIAVAIFLAALMILLTGVTVGVFIAWWFYFHVQVAFTVLASLLVLMKRYCFNEGTHYQALTTWYLHVCRHVGLRWIIVSV